MLKTGKLSVWVGNMTSEDEMLSYVDEGNFGQDFDFEINPEYGRELKVEPGDIGLPQLVEGFSSWKSFADDCVEQCNKLGIDKGSAMLVLYAFEYHPTSNVRASAPLQFIGVFDF